jgi:hypothetical protein
VGGVNPLSAFAYQHRDNRGGIVTEFAKGFRRKRTQPRLNHDQLATISHEHGTPPPRAIKKVADIPG